jgi:cell division transport system permease protein
LLTLAGLALRVPLQELASSYGANFLLQGFAPPQALGVLLGATLLGWIGAGLVTGHFLRQTRPTET